MFLFHNLLGLQIYVAAFLLFSKPNILSINCFYPQQTVIRDLLPQTIFRKTSAKTVLCDLSPRLYSLTSPTDCTLWPHLKVVLCDLAYRLYSVTSPTDCTQWPHLQIVLCERAPTPGSLRLAKALPTSHCVTPSLILRCLNLRGRTTSTY
jgi:hypothetical protein